LWKKDLADELHKPVKRKFPRCRIISNGIDQIWAADLVEIQKFTKWNKMYRYLFMVIDIVSKYRWIVPLKNKKGEYVAKALKQLLKERIPKFLWIDKGKEFYYKNVDEILKQYSIKLYSTENKKKSSVVERWN